MTGKHATRVMLAPLLVWAGVVACASPAGGEGPGNDLAPLLDRAAEAFELGSEDAVILLDEHQEHWSGDGRRVTVVHRLVWVGTDHGVHGHADLRIPYDGQRQTMQVQVLRTWRSSDARWIESGPTARVETLPFAVDRAPDYAGRREMMLLHDGVEPPCVLETVYTITDREPFRAGTGGLWSPAQADPVLEARLVLGFVGTPLQYAASGGVPEPQTGRDPSSDLDTVTFTLERLPPRAEPHTAEETASGPWVSWSTWPSWGAMGRELTSRLDAAAIMDAGLAERVQEHLEHARTDSERARLAAGLVAELTRLVEVDGGWWPSPRQAVRIWSTAYAHSVDRAVLMAAVLREAGLHSELLLAAAAIGETDLRVPTTEWFGRPLLWVEGEHLTTVVDPASGEVVGDGPLQGRYTWRPGTDSEPTLHTPLDVPATTTVRLDLRLDGETWKGRGLVTGTGALSTFADMSGLGTEARDELQRITRGVLPGATVSSCNPEVFERSAVVMGFEFEVPTGERDRLARLRLEAGSPVGVAALLDGAAVVLHEASRGSAVHLPAPLRSRVELHLEVGDLEVVFVPESSTVQGPVGRLEVISRARGQEVTVIRELVLDRASYAAHEWPELRALLLAEGDERHRTVLLR